LTELFRRDIRQADKDLKEYGQLCPVDLAGMEGEERRARVEEERRRRECYFPPLAEGFSPCVQTVAAKG
jgi:hypothetical protein